MFGLQAGRKDRSENLERAAEHMNKKTKDLRRQLRKAVVDHVCDRFVQSQNKYSRRFVS